MLGDASSSESIGSGGDALAAVSGADSTSLGERISGSTGSFGDCPDLNKIGIKMMATKLSTTRKIRSLRIGFFSITAHQLEELLVVLGRLHLALDEFQ